MEISRKDVRDAFIAAGCVPGDTVMFHSSLKSMGHVDGGAATVYDGILDAAGPCGTVAVPSLWYDGTPERTRDKFDVNTSPTYVGVIPETFRKDPRAFRSNNFSHAVCAIGARAEELTRDHSRTELTLHNPSPELLEQLQALAGDSFVSLAPARNSLESVFLRGIQARLREQQK